MRGFILVDELELDYSCSLQLERHCLATMQRNTWRRQLAVPTQKGIWKENSIFWLVVLDADKHSTCAQAIMNYLHGHCLASHCSFFPPKSIWKERKQWNSICEQRPVCLFTPRRSDYCYITALGTCLWRFISGKGGQRKKVFVYFCFAHFAFAQMGIFGIHTCMHGLLPALMMESFWDGKPFFCRRHEGRVVLYIV